MPRGLYRVLIVALVAAGWSTSTIPAFAFPDVVPVLGQRSPLWAQEKLGTDPKDTIGSSGCVVTDVAMVQSAYGFHTTPQLLNQWLTTNDGYVDDDLILWRQAMVATGGGVRWKWLHVPGIVRQLRTDDQDINDRPSAATVKSELDAGNLVVAEVRLHGSMHFVVLTGHRGDTFLINDPWYEDRSTLQARYGDYGQVVRSAHIYYRAG